MNTMNRGALLEDDTLHILPTFLRVEEEAVIEPARHDSTFRELSTKLDRHCEPTLLIYGMLVLTDEH